jgi:hypothetical protein
MIVEIFVGLILASFFFVLQLRTSRKVGELTELRKKTFECQRIIDQLQVIQKAEGELKNFLTGYKLGDPASEELMPFFGVGLHGMVNKSIGIMKDAIGQLQYSLNDNSLRVDFLNYVGRFYDLPDKIVKHKFPLQGQPHQLEYLRHNVDVQINEIQKFIDRFSKEMDFT